MEDLKLAKQVSSQDFYGVKNPVAYMGIDPTALGIHIGHLLPIKLMLDLHKKLGAKLIILIGGFTAQIGDPSGKTTIRTKQEIDITLNYSSGILNEFKRIFNAKAIFVNNKDWLDNLSLKNYLSLAYYISVPRKLDLETFSNRIENSLPLSMTEFCYADLQAIDFYQLWKDYGCNIQVGGKDQWGNISQGVRFVKKITQSEEIYGLCTNLITDSKGAKLGKSVGNAPFLNNLFNVYQFLINKSEEYLLELAEIFLDFPAENKPKALLEAIAEIYYGEDIEERKKQVEHAYNLTNSLFNTTAENAPDYLFVDSNHNCILNLMVEIGLANSNSDGKRKIMELAITVDSITIDNSYYILDKGKHKISYGKKKHYFVNIK